MDINEARQRLPALAELDDNDFVSSVQELYYPDKSPADIAKALGVQLPQPPTPPATIGDRIKDTGISLLKGAVSIPEAAVGALDYVSAGKAGKTAEDLGLRTKEASGILDQAYSPAQQAAFDRVQHAEGLWDTFKEAIKNPSVVAHSVLQSLPLMGAGGVVGRPVAALGRAAGLGAESAAVAGGAVGEGAMQATSAAEQIRQETGTFTGEQAQLAALSGALDTGIAMVGGKVAQKLGFMDPDTMLAGGKSFRDAMSQMLTSSATNGRAAKAVSRMVLEGMVSEGVLEELPQSIQEQVLQNKAMGKPLDEGVNQAAVLGMLSGAVMGGGANLLHAAGRHQPPTVPPPTVSDILNAPDIDTAVAAAHGALEVPQVPQAVQVPNVEPTLPTGVTLTGTNPADLMQRPDDFMATVKEPRSLTGSTAPDLLAGQPQDPILQPVREGVVARDTQRQDDLAGQAVDRMRRDVDAEAQGMREWPAAALPRKQPTAPSLDVEIQPGDMIQKNGAPWPTEAAARLKLKTAKREGTAVPVAGGFIARPNKETTRATQIGVAHAAIPITAPSGKVVGDEGGVLAPATAPTKASRGDAGLGGRGPDTAVGARLDVGDSQVEGGRGALTAPRRNVTIGGESIDLTPEQSMAWDAADATAMAERTRADDEFARSKGQAPAADLDMGARTLGERRGMEYKRIGMELSAERRRIAGRMTTKEQVKAEREANAMNTGMHVTVGGKPAKVLSTPFGKVRVQVEGEETPRVVARADVSRETQAHTPAPSEQVYKGFAAAGDALKAAGGAATHEIVRIPRGLVVRPKVTAHVVADVPAVADTQSAIKAEISEERKPVEVATPTAGEGKTSVATRDKNAKQETGDGLMGEMRTFRGDDQSREWDDTDGADYARLKKLREARYKTAAQEKMISVLERRIKGRPDAWKIGNGVSYRVSAGSAGAQVNRGFRVVELDRVAKTAVVRSVADTGLTTSGGNNDKIDDAVVHVGDLTHDHKYDVQVEVAKPTPEKNNESVSSAGNEDTGARWDAMNLEQRMQALSKTQAKDATKARAVAQDWIELSDAWHRSLERAMGVKSAPTPAEPERLNPTGGESAETRAKFAYNEDTLNDAERELRAVSKDSESPGDVMTGQGKFVPFETALRLAREGIASGEIRPVPAQLHLRLDLAFRDIDRLLAAAKLQEAATPPAEPTEPKHKAESLRAAGKNLAEQGAAEAGRDRQSNTARRARMAAGSESSARAQEALGQTMVNLADAIESGNADLLARITTKAQVETLDGLLLSSMVESERDMPYADQQRQKGRAPNERDVRNAKMPMVSWTNGGADREKLREAVKGKKGNKRATELLQPGGGPPSAELLAELKKLDVPEKDIKYGMGWSNLETIARLGRLQRAGITDNETLRAALTQYLAVRDGPKAEDPIKKLERALIGANVGIDFFPTPKAVAERMVQEAGITEGMKVLEPSAGSGNIAEAARSAGADVDVVEVSSQLSELLRAKGFTVAGSDFMTFEPEAKYDAVLMNPPFSDRMDAAHIQRAFGMLKPGGRLVAVAGEGAFSGSDKKAQAFRAWLDENGATVEPLPQGTFNDKSLLATTGANARLIVMESAGAAKPVFSQGTSSKVGMSPAVAQGSIDAVAAAWENAPKITVLASMSGAPTKVQDDARARVASGGGSPKAVFYDGQVYLFADQLSGAAEAIEYAYHEVLGHFGMRGKFGPALDKELRAIVTLRREEIEKMYARTGKTRSRAMDIRMAEEVVAYMAQRRPDLGFVQRIVATVKNFLRDHVPGFAGMSMSDSDIIQKFILPARQFVEGGGVPSDSSELAPAFGSAAPTFYSALSRTLASNKATSMPSIGWVGAIKAATNQGVVKADEVQWSGVEDWLKLQTGKVPKESVLEFLRDNGVQVRDVTLGTKNRVVDAARAAIDRNDSLGFDSQVEAMSALRRDFNKSGDADEVLGNYDFEHPSDRKTVKAWLEENDLEENRTKYGQYTLSGGTNYREVLLTLPDVSKPPEQLTELPDGYMVIADASQPADQRFGVIPPGQAHARPWAGRHATPEAAEEAALKRINYGLMEHHRITGGSSGYRSGHWLDTPNVLAHIRLNDRVDADGKRVLFVEELQSDWAQSARRNGVIDAEKPWQVFDARTGMAKENFATKEEAKSAAEADPMLEYADMREQGVPAAPFIGKTDAWLTLALKRVVKMAVDEGYDKVAFVNGEQSADRYDLSKHIDTLHYGKDDRGYGIQARKDGSVVVEKDGMSERELEDTIGKDVASKVVNDSGHTGDEGPHSGTLSGLDLKIGGAGMHAFYNQIVPAAANKLLAKMGGGKVVDIHFGALPDIKGNGWESTENPGPRNGPKTQAGFDITDKMREAARDGMPMFAQGGDARAYWSMAKDAVAELGNTPGKLHWWHKTVGTQYNLAKRSPAFAKVFDRVQDFLNDVSAFATESADLAPNILPRLNTWKDMLRTPLSSKDTKAISAPIFEGTLMWTRVDGNPVGVDTLEERMGRMSADDMAGMLMNNGKLSPQVIGMWRGLPLEQFQQNVTTAFKNRMLLPGIVWTADELKSRYGLTKEQSGFYDEFRASVDKSIHQLAISDMLRYGGKDLESLREQAINMGDVGAVSQLIRARMMDVIEQQPDRSEVLTNTMNAIQEKAARALQLMEQGYAPLTRFGHYTVDVVSPDGERLYFGMYENRFEAARAAKRFQELARNDDQFKGATITRGTLSQEDYKLFAGVSPETIELFGEMLGLEAQGDSAKDMAFQEYLKLSKSTRSSMKRLIHRKGIAGFSDDVGRVLAGFVYSNARQSSRNLHMGEIDSMANDIDKRQGELRDAAIKLADYIKNPVEEANALRGLLFAQYLGGSVAAALVNMTQPFAITMPYLSQTVGIARSAALMKDAVKVAWAESTGDAKLNTALKKAVEQGIVAPQEVHQLIAQAAGKGGLRSGDGTKFGDAAAAVNNGLSRLQLGWGKFFSTAELFNRRVTFVAAYRAAVEKNIADPYEFAVQAVDATQFIYNKGNKPTWARGPIGSTLFTFKQYSISYLELMSRMATAGEPGSPERAAGRRAALFAMAMVLMMGGGGGLPFEEDVGDLVDGIAQRLGYNFSTKQKRQELLDEAFGRGLGHMLEKGVSGLPGVPIDVAGRLGMGNLIPGTGLLQQKQDHTQDVLEVGGAAASFAKNVFTAADLASSGRVIDAGLAVAPTAASNLAKAIDMASSGMYKDQNGYKVLDVEGYEALAKAIGFQPQSVARVQEANREEQAMIGRVRLRENEISQLWAQGLATGDPDKVQRAREQLEAWNDKNHDTPIKIKAGDVLKRAKNMQMDRATRIEKAAPKEVRAAVHEKLQGE